MITSFFRKSTPLNYLIVLLIVFFSFFLYQSAHVTAGFTWELGLEKTILFVLIIASAFLTNFIIKKNGLSKDSTYAVFFYASFLLFFPTVLDNKTILAANFFVLLALRRLMSLHSPKSHKEKIFDASLWIFVAALFHFWSILFILVVFSSLFFNIARDYRNWVLPFIAFFTIVIIFVSVTLLFQTQWIAYLLESAYVDYKINYFKNSYQNIALSLFVPIALFFLFSLLVSLSNRPLVLMSSFKKIIMTFVIGVVIFIISPNKSSDLLLFTFAPLAMMANSYIEIIDNKWQKEIVFYSILICGLFAFFTQL
jgi:hypothetical protein